MLKRCFSQHDVLTEHDFSEIPETKIEPIYQAWLSLPDTQHRKMERDFKEIDTPACEGGVKAMKDEAEWHGENLAQPLSEKEGFHEKAFWVFLERPRYRPATGTFRRADSISSSQWNECRTINLAKELSHYYHAREGRGKNRTV